MKKYHFPRIAVMTLSIMTLWIVVCYFGEIVGLAANGTCYKYVGCTDGFFGFDAIEHFLFGVTLVWGVIWACRTFPKYSILRIKPFETMVALISFVALIAVFWEFAECAHDAFRLYVLNNSYLLNFRLHIDLLDQPTNLDTMGDIAFSLFGGIVSLFFITW